MKTSVQLIKIAQQIKKQQQGKIKSDIKSLYNKVKKMLNIETLYKHKLKDKIVQLIIEVIQNLEKRGLLNQGQVNQLKQKLNGKNVRVAGKKGFIFGLVLVLINLIMPLTSYCNNVSQSQQKKMIDLLKNDKIYCFVIDQKQKSDVESTYSQKQIQNAKRKVSVSIQYMGKNIISQNIFQLLLDGSGNIIKPDNMNNKQFNDMITKIAIFDKDNTLGLRQKCNDSVQQFIKFNEKQIQSMSTFSIIQENNGTTSFKGYEQYKTK